LKTKTSNHQQRQKTTTTINRPAIVDLLSKFKLKVEILNFEFFTVVASSLSTAWLNGRNDETASHRAVSFDKKAGIVARVLIVCAKTLQRHGLCTAILHTKTNAHRPILAFLSL
jgi:hypothetical protein